MEAITVCASAIVVFGLWVEFEPAIKALVNMICKSKFVARFVTNYVVQKPTYGLRMPICVAKVTW